MEPNEKRCKYCKEAIPLSAKKCPKCGKTLYTPVWAIILIAFVAFIGMVGYYNENNTSNYSYSGSYNSNEKNKTTNTKKQVKVIDFSNMDKEDITTWCEKNNIICYIKSDYSDTIEINGFVSQSIQADEKVDENGLITVVYSLGKKPTIGQKNALEKAKSYSNNLHMSKSGIYRQLTSEYGEGFTPEEAQYAIDNINADWNANALAKAKSYQQNLHMSKNRIYEQLTSEYGEGFTPEEAQYAIDNLED